jgi:hypothetical protein
MPMLVVWGTEDSVIPVRHAGVAAEIAPGATVEVVGNAGHFPHKDHPQRFVKIVNDFIGSTEPAVYHRGPGEPAPNRRADRGGPGRRARRTPRRRRDRLSRTPETQAEARPTPSVGRASIRLRGRLRRRRPPA